MRYSAHGPAPQLAEDGDVMLMAHDTKVWTLDELHALPDDGNKYELVRGALFVTPAPSVFHEIIAARLTEILLPYVREFELGNVFRPRAIVPARGSEAEPDLMVWKPRSVHNASWDEGPPPLLVVEILSPYTRRRDWSEKRAFYLEDCRADEYWIADPDDSTITRVRTGQEDVRARDALVWHPQGASRALVVNVEEVFSRE